jgi:hypothetical protein
VERRLILSVVLVLSISLIVPAIAAYAAEPSPKDVYILKQKALESLDFAEFGKYVTKENLTGIKEAQDPKAMMFLIRKLKTPTEFTVEKEEINGNSAVVFLKGRYPLDPNNPEKIEPGYGKAMFKKEGTSWKFLIEKWQANPWK